MRKPLLGNNIATSEDHHVRSTAAVASDIGTSEKMVVLCRFIRKWTPESVQAQLRKAQTTIQEAYRIGRAEKLKAEILAGVVQAQDLGENLAVVIRQREVLGQHYRQVLGCSELEGIKLLARHWLHAGILSPTARSMLEDILGSSDGFAKGGN